MHLFTAMILVHRKPTHQSFDKNGFCGVNVSTMMPQKSRYLSKLKLYLKEKLLEPNVKRIYGNI